MAGLAALIKGIDVASLDAKGVLGCLANLLLGRGHGRTICRFRIDGLGIAFRLLALAAVFAAGLIGASIAASGLQHCCCCSGRILQQHHVSDDFHLGH